MKIPEVLLEIEFRDKLHLSEFEEGRKCQSDRADLFRPVAIDAIMPGKKLLSVTIERPSFLSICFPVVPAICPPALASSFSLGNPRVSLVL